MIEKYIGTAVFAVCIAANAFPSPAGAQEFFTRAPDTLPGTLPEMRDPAYWTARMEKPDEVILDPAGIRALNERYMRRMRDPRFFDSVAEERMPPDYFYPGVALYPADLYALSPAQLADTARTHIGYEIDYLWSRKFGNVVGVEYAEWELKEIVAEMALDRVGGSIVPRSGITVRASRLRNVPALLPLMVGTNAPGSHRWDRWGIALLKIASPVTVLHRSASGEFCLVQCSIGYGWLRSDDIAFGNREEIAAFAEPERFVVSTEDRTMFFSTERCEFAAGFFMMGNRLPLADNGNPRCVKVPVRRTNGDFAVETAWLEQDADVSVGFLPYTRRNIVETAFKLLDDPYDWTGAWYGRNHETAYTDVFACFGFELPHRDPLFTFFGDNDTVLLPSAGREAQLKAMLEHEPFVTLQSCGRHGQLLLGEHNGEPVVFDMHGYGYTVDGIRYEVMRCNIGTLMLPEYFLERNITFLELK